MVPCSPQWDAGWWFRVSSSEWRTRYLAGPTDTSHGRFLTARELAELWLSPPDIPSFSCNKQECQMQWKIMIDANGSFTLHSDCRELSLLKHHGSCVAVARQRHASEYRDDMFNLHNQMNYGTNIFGLVAKRKNMLSPSHIFCHGFACCCYVCRHTIVVRAFSANMVHWGIQEVLLQQRQWTEKAA